MILPKDVQRTLQNRGTEAAASMLRQRYGMSGEAARQWVQAREAGPIASRHHGMGLNRPMVAFFMTAACLGGMAIAAIEKAM